MPTNEHTGEQYDITSRGTNEWVCLLQGPLQYAPAQLLTHLHTRETNGTIACPRMATTDTTTATSTLSHLVCFPRFNRARRDGSYYYQNYDGSRYYNDGQGYGRHTSSDGKVSESHGK